MYGGDFGSRLKHAREAKGIKRRELADRVGCTYEVIRLWEKGEHLPTYRSLMKLSSELGYIALDPMLDSDTAADMSEDSISEFMLLSFIKNRLELSVYPKCGKLYLTKRFTESLEYGIDVYYFDDRPGELMIQERTDKPISNIYRDKKLVRRISNILGTQEKIKYIMIKDGNAEGCWYGLALPSLFGGAWYWDTDRDRIQTDLNLSHKVKSTIFNALKRASEGFVDDEEIDQFISIGAQVILSEKRFTGISFIYHVFMASFAMMNELKAIERHCRRAESKLSLDQPAKYDKHYTFGHTCGAEDACFLLIEIKDFVGRLTLIEKMVLDLKYKNIDWMSAKSLGPNIKKLIVDNTEILKKKAIEYFEEDYIHSLLEFN